MGSPARGPRPSRRESTCCELGVEARACPDPAPRYVQSTIGPFASVQESATHDKTIALMFDLVIVVAYFVAIFAIGMRSRVAKDVSTDEYFLSSRSLKWPSIAISTIATNISAGHFISMA